MGLNTENSAVNNFVNNGICIKCGSQKIRYSSNNCFCDNCKDKICKINEKEMRMEWEYKKINLNRIDYEIEKYNRWAKNKMDNIKVEYEEKEKWYEYDIYSRNPPVRERSSFLGGVRDIKGWDVLDIGGSCLDSWRFLPAGAASLSQVEPASDSQRLATKRLDRAFSNSSIDWRDKVLFHTAVAEQLPFQRNTFDLVFSRSSIHHTSRPRSLMESFRVLKPGGYLLLIEPRYSTLLDLMRMIYRKLKNVDRGSDKPLTYSDVRYIKGMSTEFKELRYRIVNPLSILFGKNMRLESIYVATNRDIKGIEFLFEKSFIIAKK